METSTCGVPGCNLTVAHACPLASIYKGNVNVDVIWAHADDIRVLDDLYAKRSKLPMRDPYGIPSPVRNP